MAVFNTTGITGIKQTFPTLVLQFVVRLKPIKFFSNVFPFFITTLHILRAKNTRMMEH